jgi:putative sigma-54 modulation protein
MEFIFEYHDVSTSEYLENMVKEKLMHLSEKYSSVIRADVFFKEENTSDVDTGKICNIRLSLPGPRIFAEASSDNYVSAITDAVNHLERQLRKRKEKSIKH